jgi:tetratricopeptide (TPR) repeat protein
MEVSTTDSSEITTTAVIQSTYDLDSVYMISDSCMDCLIRMKMLPTEKDDFVSLCLDALQGKDKLLAIIQEFQESYTADRAISWLYRDPFFRGFLDNIFKIGLIDAMYPCRVFIRDIQKQLEQHKCTSTIQVYQSEIISDEQLQNLKTFNEKIIAMKYFFLTNSDRAKALSYTSEYSSSNEYKRILFIIEANPQIENVKPFAKISSIGYNNDQNDVLFMIGSLFKIIEIQDEKDGIINVKLTLCANDDTNRMKQLFDQAKYRYIDENGETDVIRFSQFLFDIGHSMRDSNLSNSGEKLIRSCLDKLPNDHPNRPRCYDALGNIYLFQGNLDLSLEWYNNSYDFKKKLGTNDLDLAESYKNLAPVYLQKGDLKTALEFFQQILIIWKQFYGEYCFNLIYCYTNLAIIYEGEENLMDAISCYYQALAIMLKHEAASEASFAAVYNNLGTVYTKLKHYHLALGYYYTSLEVKAKIQTPINPSIAATYKNIGLVHGYMNNVEKSRENLEKAAEIYRQIYQADNENVKDIEELIQNLPNNEQS